MPQQRHALVTGGGTGIGLGIAQALAAAGHKVTITGRRAEVLEEAAAATPGLFPLVMDVAEEASVTEGVEAARLARGPITICVPNAGIAEGKSMLKTDLAFWRKMVGINLDGVFLTIRACLPDMVAANWGRVVAVSSMAGLRGLRGAPTYTATKHGVIGLIRSLSEDYVGKADITFNALCPGYVATDIVTRNTTSIAQRAGISEEEALQIMIRSNRHNRLISVDEVAEAAMWLVSEKSGSVNGQAIQISGGS